MRVCKAVQSIGTARTLISYAETGMVDEEYLAVKKIFDPVLLKGPANEGADPSRILVDR